MRLAWLLGIFSASHAHVLLVSGNIKQSTTVLGSDNCHQSCSHEVFFLFVCLKQTSSFRLNQSPVQKGQYELNKRTQFSNTGWTWASKVRSVFSYLTTQMNELFSMESMLLLPIDTSYFASLFAFRHKLFLLVEQSFSWNSEKGYIQP